MCRRPDRQTNGLVGWPIDQLNNLLSFAGGLTDLRIDRQTHSLTKGLTDCLTQIHGLSFCQIDQLTESLTDRLTVKLADWLTDSPTDWRTDWHRLTHWLTDWLIDSMTSWLIDCLTHWPAVLTHWLISWIIDLLTDWLKDLMVSLLDWLILSPACGSSPNALTR